MLSSLLSCFCNSFREMLWLLQSVLVFSLCIHTVHSCVDNYFLFEELTFGNNSENRLKLYQAFYRPNKHLPYSVAVTYRSISNGTHVNISTDPSCPHKQEWLWLAHPIFVIQEPTVLNHLTLFLLNYFEEWIPPHVELTVPYPCQGQAKEFLEQMTTSLQSYALGENTRGEFKGNFAFTCDDIFKDVDSTATIAAASGLIFLVIFVNLTIPGQFRSNSHLQALVSNANDYSFVSFGLFWGASTTLFISVIFIICLDYSAFMILFTRTETTRQVVIIIYGIFLFLPPFASAITIASRSTLTFPHLFPFRCVVRCCTCSFLAQSTFCCSTRTWATFGVIWIDMVALQLLCYHGAVIFLTIPAAPVVIVSNVLYVVLMAVCTVYILAFLFTLHAKLVNCFLRHVENSVFLTYWAAGMRSMYPSTVTIKDDDWVYLISAFLLIPFLLAVGSFSSLIALSGKYVNSATNQDSFHSFLLSVFIPVILSGTAIALKWFINNWLRNNDSQKKLQESPQQKVLPQKQVLA